MQNKSHQALKARLSKCHSLQEVVAVSRRVTNPFLNPHHEDRPEKVSLETEQPSPKRQQPKRWS